MTISLKKRKNYLSLIQQNIMNSDEKTQLVHKKKFGISVKIKIIMNFKKCFSDKIFHHKRLCCCHSKTFLQLMFFYHFAWASGDIK